MKKLSLMAAIAIAVGLLAFTAQANAFTLPDPETPLTYLGFLPASEHGDFYSYSLPILAIDYDIGFGGGVGPGNPYYVVSTPGAIKNDIVIATGADGKPIYDNSNNGLMDDAYPTPNSAGITTFNTTTTADPNPSFAGDQAITWDATISALSTYLDGQDLIFFFNHNEENSGSTLEQSLWGWGRVALVDLEGNLTTKYLYFANDGNTTYTQYTPNPDNFVLAPGQLTLGNYTINHNLGANQAAYAIISPELNDILNDLSNPLYSDYDVLQLELRLMGLSNGYEQLFIQRGDRVTNIIPEPSSLVLLSMGALGAFGLIRRKKN